MQENKISKPWLVGQSTPVESCRNRYLEGFRRYFWVYYTAHGHKLNFMVEWVKPFSCPPFGRVGTTPK
ncbi:hypothetical protein BGP_3920 [Beggiatoa sp. PS]|nr:hypothetical protein BGP_3920 [Beggiatoa sp. PS]